MGGKREPFRKKGNVTKNKVCKKTFLLNSKNWFTKSKKKPVSVTKGVMVDVPWLPLAKQSAGPNKSRFGLLTDRQTAVSPRIFWDFFQLLPAALPLPSQVMQKSSVRANVEWEEDSMQGGGNPNSKKNLFS